jgi:ABC-type amino acid transport substrate-binding protein
MTEFAEEARQALRDLVARYGSGLAEEPHRVQGLLRDLAGSHRREISALVVAAEEGVGAALVAASDSLGPATADRLARRLQSDRALMEDAAQWAVETWAIALGVRTGATLPTQQPKTEPSTPTSAPPPPPPPPPLHDSASKPQPPLAPTAPISAAEPTVAQPPESTPRPPDIREPPPQRRSRRGLVVAVAAAALLVAAVATLGGGSDPVIEAGESSPPPTTALSTTAPPPTIQTTTAPGGATTAPASNTQTTTPTATTAPAGATTLSSLTGRGIIDRGLVSIGINTWDSLPFRGWDGQDAAGLDVGFDVDLTRELVNRLFGPIDIELVELSRVDRFDTLNSGVVDMFIGSEPHTTSSETLAAFTSPYFLDGPGLTVRRGGPVHSSGGGPKVALESLNGTLINVYPGDRIEPLIRDALDAAGLAADFVPWEPGLYSWESTGDDALGESYGGALRGVADTPSHEALLLYFDVPIAVAVPLGHDEFRDEVDEALVSMVRDGTVESLYLEYIGGNVPWTEDELLQFAPADW